MTKKHSKNNYSDNYLFGTVEVVGIDHGEGFADGVRRHHHGVVGAPRLDAPFGFETTARAMATRCC